MNINKKTLPLSSIPIGYSAEIASIKSNFENKERLLELGFTKDTKITVLHKSPSGDPIAYGIRGAVMALRKEDADNILITVKEEY